MEIHVLNRWGCLTGVMRYAIGLVETPYVLVVQHDLAFVRHYDIEHLLLTMNSNPGLKHVRFNKRATLPVAADVRGPGRLEIFGAADLVEGSSDVVQTALWSDNNHVASTSYYRSIVFPLIGNHRSFMETCFEPIDSPNRHQVFGTFIAGAMGDPPMITHLDGRRTALSLEVNIAKKILLRFARSYRRLAAAGFGPIVRRRFRLLEAGLLRKQFRPISNRGHIVSSENWT